ncbi:MAG: hypothetical protein JXQ73_14690 [Phycisphaerae bacterium]|nr:hypothetical protein [Phycisphaerae bacterium]
MIGVAVNISVLALSGIGSGSQAAWEPRFVRSGQVVSLDPRMREDERAEFVSLRAFGRLWPASAAVRGAVVELTGPEVRVPVVFRIVRSDDSSRELGELVVYADRPATWPSERRLYTSATPRWFDEWTAALGLPTHRVNAADLRSGRWVRHKGKHDLLVVGRVASGNSAADVGELARRCDINVLALDAAWFGERGREALRIELKPAAMSGELADLAAQRWATAPTFSRPARPTDAVVNRRSWIEVEGQPLVEELPSRDGGRSCVASYLRWSQQLGRCELADVILLTILERSAERARQEALRASVSLIGPKEEDIRSKDRPVLARLRFEKAMGPADILIVDLRGRGQLDPNLGVRLKRADTLMRAQGGQTGGARLLVLGDDEVLDGWSAVKVNREKKTLGREGAIWLADDDLPPSSIGRIRLMGVLTKLKVPIWEDIEEKSND